MNQQQTLLAAAVAACLSASVNAEQTFSDKVSSLVTDGKASVDLRYRFEYVDQDGKDEEAEASLLRSRLTLASAEVDGFSLLMEMDDVRNVGPNDYNSTDNGKTYKKTWLIDFERKE